MIDKYIDYANHIGANKEVLKWVNTNLLNFLNKYSGQNNTKNLENQDEIEHIIDYLSSDKSPKNMHKMAYSEAKTNTDKWNKALIKKGSKIDEIVNKIHHGDARELIKKVQSDSIACIFIDVPYKNSSGGANSKNGGGFGGKNDKSNLDNMKSGKIFDYNNIKPEEYLAEHYRVLEETGHIYLMVNSKHLASMQMQMEQVGFKINNILVMRKKNKVVAPHYMKDCEFVIFARKGGSKGLNDYGIPSVVDVVMPKGNEKIHKTEKPYEYVKKLIANSTQLGDTVADFFSGSGNVARIAKDLSLNFICCEIDEKFHKLSVEALEKHKG